MRLAINDIRKDEHGIAIGYLLTLATSWFVWCVVNITNYIGLSGSELWGDISHDFAENALEALILYVFSVISCRVMMRHLWDSRDKQHALVLGLTVHVFINASFAIVVAWIYALILPFEKNIFHHILLSDFFVVEIFSTVYLAMFLVSKNNEEARKRILAESESRNNEILALQTKLDMLTLQANNHFIFNSFSTAAGLMRRDPESAERFLKKLSSMYRYLTRNSGAHVVTLMEELGFVEDYINMLGFRYTGISARISPEIRSIQAFVPPASIQSLIENAVKHNSHGPEQKLGIDITSDGSSVIVTNNIIRRQDEPTGTHTGLDNLRSRYGLLTDRNITVENDGLMFRVSLPLLFEEDLSYEGTDN